MKRRIRSLSGEVSLYTQPTRAPGEFVAYETHPVPGGVDMAVSSGKTPKEALDNAVEFLSACPGGSCFAVTRGLFPTARKNFIIEGLGFDDEWDWRVLGDSPAEEDYRFDTQAEAERALNLLARRTGWPRDEMRVRQVKS